MKERKAPKEKQPPDPASEAWNKLPWRKLEKHCYHIQNGSPATLVKPFAREETY
jgi:hypothetical protein